MYEDNNSISDMTKETLRLTQENNRMIKAMRRDAMIGGVVRILLWLAALGIAYFVTMTYLEPMLGAFSGGEGMNPEDIRQMFEQYQELLNQ